MFHELNFDFVTKIKLMLTPFEPGKQNVFVEVGILGYWLLIVRLG